MRRHNGENESKIFEHTDELVFYRNMCVSVLIMQVLCTDFLLLLQIFSGVV